MTTLHEHIAADTKFRDRFQRADCVLTRSDISYHHPRRLRRRSVARRQRRPAVSDGTIICTDSEYLLDA